MLHESLITEGLFDSRDVDPSEEAAEKAARAGINIFAFREQGAFHVSAFHAALTASANDDATSAPRQSSLRDAWDRKGGVGLGESLDRVAEGGRGIFVTTSGGSSRYVISRPQVTTYRPRAPWEN